MLNIKKSKSFWVAVMAGLIALITYEIKWYYNAVASFLVFFIDAFTLLIYIIVVLNSLIFWIINKRFGARYLPFVINLAIINVICCLPSSTKNKNHPFYKGRLCETIKNNCDCNLAIETYKVIGGGYMTTDVNSVYITDYKNFREYVGTCDDHNESIDISCKGDTIITIKTSSDGLDTEWTDPKIIERKTFNLTKLKMHRVFD